ncbi:Uncharacterised protein [Vibrio cholerae]|nr:Uncharacterised protein [Vibrio cholerae]
MPNLSIAASVSPPPATEKPSDCAIASAIPRVPASKFLNSNTPTGPFHRIVFAFFRISASSAVEFGPKSKIMSSS